MERRMFKASTLCLLIILSCPEAYSFCGFYVAKAGTNLFNRASKVVLVRDENKTVLTMANDYSGEAKEFAVVVPVPEVLEQGQINVAESALIDHLDAYTSPRLVEYHDGNPCMARVLFKGMISESAMSPKNVEKKKNSDLGVKIEAQYIVGEYDIIILSAEKSSGLLQWLQQNEYKIPDKAKSILGSYIKQGLKFFVAKVNLEEFEKTGNSFLRPLQMAFQSPRFGLPIRLGTVNAQGDQELFLFTLTKKGRVETVNYRTVKIPSEVEIPTYVKEKKVFDKFYTDMFQRAWEKEDKKVAFLEYAWDMGWCDPCAADPLSRDQLKKLGVFWLDENADTRDDKKKMTVLPRGGAVNTYVTRLHIRYNASTFPDDIKLQVTANKQNFQGRYIMRHPYTGEMKCEAADRYLQNLKVRQEKEANNLADLTGWDKKDILSKSVNPMRGPAPKKKKWWKGIWN